jgi:SAM-dependent methyltransferase
MEITSRETCRVCDSSNLAPVFWLGDLYVSDFVTTEGQGRKGPLKLVLCGKCSLLQLKHTVPQELLYSRFYWYRSGVTDTMRRALRDITENIERLIPFEQGDVVLDIGANDGTLLGTYTSDQVIKVGCEPADNLITYLQQRADYVLHDFWNYEKYEMLAARFGFGKAKVVTAIGMFYDMEDPNKFISDARMALANDGIFVAQLMCLRQMLQKNDLGNICHEHLEYYSLESLKVLFEQNGLEIFKIEENDVNGGSYRLYSRHYKSTGIPLDETFTIEDYRAFFKRVNENRRKCVDFVKQEVHKGKTVFVYGASTKGNTILQYYGLDHKLITAASERSPEKWGKFTVGTMIPIVSEEQARIARPDYFLVLPWAFFEEFYQREKEWRETGGKFIVPLPEFRVVG